jgi:8-oxo-dGTP pyrophosphatase MutT (NUDIX family)
MTDRESLQDAFGAFLDRLSARLRPVDVPAFPGGGTIHAAVILLLRPAAKAAGDDVDGSAEVLFIRRAQREGDPWSGHVAFPGGRPAAADPDLLAVAVRETVEEVGIDVRRGGRVLGRLPTVEPQSRRLPPVDVTPFVALAPEGAGAHLDPGEVEDAFWVPLSSLRDAGRSEVVRYVVGGGPREWSAYPSPAGPIWGITERILTGFLALVAG